MITERKESVFVDEQNVDAMLAELPERKRKIFLKHRDVINALNETVNSEQTMYPLESESESMKNIKHGDKVITGCHLFIGGALEYEGQEDNQSFTASLAMTNSIAGLGGSLVDTILRAMEEDEGIAKTIMTAAIEFQIEKLRQNSPEFGAMMDAMRKGSQPNQGNSNRGFTRQH